MQCVVFKRFTAEELFFGPLAVVVIGGFTVVIF